MNHTALRITRMRRADENTPESLRGFKRISIRVQRPLDWKPRNCQQRNRMIANQFDATVEINRNDAFSPGDAHFAIKTMIIVYNDI